MTLSIPQGSMGDRTYTANWSAVAYSIAYELNGGILAEANPDGYNFASETFTLLVKLALPFTATDTCIPVALAEALAANQAYAPVMMNLVSITPICPDPSNKSWA